MKGFQDSFLQSVRAVAPWVMVEENRLSRLSPLTLRYILEYKKGRLEGIRERRRRLLVEAEEEFDLGPLLRLKESVERMDRNILIRRAEIRELLLEEKRRIT